MVTALGVVIRPQSPPESFPELFRSAEALGLQQVWLWEDCFLEGGISAAAVALAATSTLTVGVGLLPVPLRNVALSGMEIATIERMFPGRLRVAVGHGVQGWMAQVGARPTSPLTLMREYLPALQALLSGETVSTDGDYVHLHDVTLGWPPAAPTRVLMGATGPRSLQVCGEVADGVVIVEDTSPDGLREALQIIAHGRESAGRTGEFDVVAYLRAYRGPDALAHLSRDGKHPTGNYSVVLEQEAVRQAVAELGAAGATTVVLVPAGDDPSVVDYLAAAAGIIAAL
jgi:alkanesulfonate monooxygenase SsuD/methylene tetrahydromethanopterin reductase-like flavin-dependent oxidoreductase (luciferase family)